MAKINVCDICLREDKLTFRTGKYRLKGHRKLSLDYCDNHHKSVPKEGILYAQYVWQIKFGVEITEEQAKEVLRRSL